MIENYKSEGLKLINFIMFDRLRNNILLVNKNKFFIERIYLKNLIKHKTKF